MFTAAYRGQAERLAASCSKFGLPYEIHEVPTGTPVHSPHGSEDLSFTKANFIHHLLAVHSKPVLYLDADANSSPGPFS